MAKPAIRAHFDQPLDVERDFLAEVTLNRALFFDQGSDAVHFLFGEVLDGPEAERVGLAYRCVDDDALLASAQEMAARAADAPRELSIVTKQTLRDMATVDDHPAAVERELEPQVWSAGQPWFAERIAALQAKISKKQP